MVVPEVQQIANGFSLAVRDITSVSVAVNGWIVIITMVVLSFSWAISIAQRIINGGNKDG